jgi:hypothetical protein
MDISQFLLTPQPAYTEEGGLSDIGSTAYRKKALARHWGALDTIYVEFARGPCVSVPAVPRETITWTSEGMRELTLRLLETNNDT